MRESDAAGDTDDPLLSEAVDLDATERQRVLAAVRSLDRGDYLELLGVSDHSTKDELKRAHERLQATWHRDQFHGRALGSFGPLIERVYETASETLRALASRTVGPAGPRRRTSDRYAFPLRMTAHCESWRTPATVVAQDISESGMFLVTSSRAEPGERITVTITTRRNGDIALPGRVVVCRVAETARKTERRPGIGVELGPLDHTTRDRYERVLEAARLAAPMPALEVNTERRRSRLARGSGSYDRPTTVVGIDLGTSHVSVSAAVGNRVLVLPWTGGHRASPAVVAFPTPGEMRVGVSAVARMLTDPAHTVVGVKRLLGRLITDRNVGTVLDTAAYRATPSADGGVSIEQWGEEHRPERIAAELLRAAADTAERHLELPVDRAVLTVPVSFTPDRVDALVRAAGLANLEVIELVDEPTAIALAHRDRNDLGGIIAVFDLGGGSFEVSIVDASAGDVRVLGTAGDATFGGEDFDRAIAETAAAQVSHSHGVDLRATAIARQKLILAAERAKRVLSERDETSLLLPAVLPAEPRARDLRIRLTRATCERLWAPLVDRVTQTADRALKRAGLAPSALTAVVLAGGSARIPLLRRAIEAHIAAPLVANEPLELAACLGAGVRAAQIDRCSTARTVQG